MTTTDDILALTANAAPSEEAAGDLALFADAAARGMNSTVVRALRGLRPASGAPALPDSPAWRAWLSATAAIAGDEAQGLRGEEWSRAVRPADRTVRYVVCAAATAVGDERPAAPSGAPAVGVEAADAAGVTAAVGVGVRAAALVESRLVSLTDPGGWSLPAVSAVIGAGLAAGLMLGLTPAQLRCTLGICATQAAGLHAADATDAGPLQAGKAAFNAVEATKLAELGFTSSGEPLDGRRALFALFSA
ncbi:MAG TPA: MmgE/PrpD family protein [Trebonia sp.]|nr:MmgE/PrpD family protein [Trebonia sp.]